MTQLLLAPGDSARGVGLSSGGHGHAEASTVPTESQRFPRSSILHDQVTARAGTGGAVATGVGKAAVHLSYTSIYDSG